MYSFDRSPSFLEMGWVVYHLLVVVYSWGNGISESNLKCDGWFKSNIHQSHVYVRHEVTARNPWENYSPHSPCTNLPCCAEMNSDNKACQRSVDARSFKTIALTMCNILMRRMEWNINKCLPELPGPLLPTWIAFNPSMDKKLYPS